MNNEEKIIIDLDTFVRAKYPLPSSRHPMNNIMGGFVIHAIKNFAVNFYKEKPNLDEYKLLQMMKRKYPYEDAEEYSHALERARRIYNEFRRAYRQGIVHGVPCLFKTVAISDSISLSGKPTLIAGNTKEIYIIKTFSLRSPVREEMPDIFCQAVGLSLLYPPPYRIWLCGFSTGQLQTKIIEPTEDDRKTFIQDLKGYVKKIKEKEVRNE